MDGKLKTIASTILRAIDKKTHVRDLNGLTVVITGASKGIGKGIADHLYENGANLVLVSRTIEKSTFKNWKSSRYILVKADLNKINDVNNVVKATIEKFKKVDVLINNVGLFASKPLEEFTSEEFDLILATNVKSMFLLTSAFLPIFKKQREGFIINMGSKISRNTNVAEHKVLYAMTKYAIEGFSFSLNRELKRFGIRVTCLMPGTVNTFVSLKSSTYLDVKDISLLVAQLIKLQNIDFEGLVFKSNRQDI
jgi:short-subunit dehydrogenase